MDGDVAVYINAAKTKFTPVKTLILPRLELSEATVGVKLLHSIKLAVEARSMAKPDSFLTQYGSFF